MIKSEHIDHIVEEIDFVLKKMQKAQVPEEKLYYFSAAHGVISRVMNFQCDPVLVFAHQVLSTVHAAFTGRLAAMKSKEEKQFAVIPEMVEKLQEVLNDFKAALQRQEIPEIHIALQRFANLGFVPTGNGFYLYQKGVVKI